MATVTKTFELKVQVQDSEVDALNANLKKTEEDIGGIEAAGDKMTGGLVSGFKGAMKGVKSMIMGLKTMKGAIIATGIGALVILVTSLTAAFTSTEEGQNKLAKGMAILGSITGNIIDLFAALGNGIMNAFSNPVESIIKLKDLIIENITNRITSLIETFGFLGSAIKKVFERDFSGALEDAKKAGSSYIDTMTGVKDSIDKVGDSVGNLANELIREGKIAAGIADQRAKADKLDRDLTVERAEANRKRADLLDKSAQKENFTAKERIQFLTEAGEIEDEITAKEIVAAKLRFDAKVAENKLAGSTKSDLEEEANLKAQLINLETAKLMKAKAVSAQILGAKREEAAELKVIEDQATLDQETADALIVDKAKTLKDLEKQIKEAEAVSEDERRALEIEKTIEHYDQLILLADDQNLATEGLVKAKLAAVAKFSKAEADVQIKFADMTQDEKLGLAKGGLNDMATILGKESAAGKAAAIASATISTFESAQSSYNSLSGIPIVGPVLGALAAGAAITSGFAQVKAITATKLPSLNGQAAPSVSGGTPSAPSISKPPAFNTVGASDTNQLAGAIGQQEQKPVKAFVLSNDVTTAQGLERNIVEGATI